jgi:hypothetical protein
LSRARSLSHPVPAPADTSTIVNIKNVWGFRCIPYSP